MIRIFHAYFPARTIVLGISEGLLAALAFFLALFAWVGRDTDLVLNYENGFLKIGLAASVFIITMYYRDLYDSLVLSNRAEVITRLLQVVGAGTLMLACIYYAFPQVQLSRPVVLSGLALLLILLATWREAFFFAVQTLHLGQRTLLLGDSALASALAREVQKRPEAGIDLVGYMAGGEPEGIENLAYLGGHGDLERVVRERRVQRIVVALNDRRGALPVDELLALKKQGTDVVDGVDLYERVTGRVPLDNLRMSWLLFSPGFLVSNAMQVYKRLFSLLLAVPLFVLTFPVMALLWLVIRLDSPGAAIFQQARVGRQGRVFTLYKFRTMLQGSENVEAHAPATANDPRLTRVGKWLRRTRLDELPQLYNILRGDMHFVGPRPFVPDQEKGCAGQIPFYSHRWAVRPGATGWAQVNRGYCVTLDDNREKLSYDLYYIKNMSLGLDLLILFMTFKILLLGRGGQ